MKGRKRASCVAPSAILCAVVQTAAGQSSAKAEVRSGHFSTSESGIS